MMRLLQCIFLCFFCTSANAQHHTISGVVKDEKGETLPGAGILISGYKIGTVANQDGKFILGNIKPGNYDILVQMVGFLPYTRNVLISDKSVAIDVVLKENTVELNEVVIKADPDRPYYLGVFRNFFIGKTPNSEKCTILNPEVLYINYDKVQRKLTVNSNEFIVIENKALGYRIKYLLQYFEYDYNTRVVFYAGHPSFEDLKGSNARKKRWIKNRETAYMGSNQHFFKALFDNKVREEGFIINKLIKIPNTSRPPDDIIKARLATLIRQRTGPLILGTPEGDSVQHWTDLKNQPKFINTLNRAEVLADTLVKQESKDLKMMNYKDALYVIYTREKETSDYTESSGHAINRPMDMPNYQISVVNLLEAPVRFYANGGIFDPRSLLYEGFWAYEKIGDMVPMDYLPAPK